jgi:hypothetical protein
LAWFWAPADAATNITSSSANRSEIMTSRTVLSQRGCDLH